MILPKKLKKALAGSVQRVLDASYAVYSEQFSRVVHADPSTKVLSVDEFSSLVAEKLRKGEN